MATFFNHHELNYGIGVMMSASIFSQVRSSDSDLIPLSRFLFFFTSPRPFAHIHLQFFKQFTLDYTRIQSVILKNSLEFFSFPLFFF